MASKRGELEAKCREYRHYPQNLIRSSQFKHVLLAHRERLDGEEGRLFDPDPERTFVILLDAADKDGAFEERVLYDLGEILDCFSLAKPDPLCRHIFIEASHSRAPFDCSRDMFSYIMSFHQVTGHFLEFAFGFGRQDAPRGFHYTAFRYENCLSQDFSREKITELSRSGRGFQQCYNLWSPEGSQDGLSPWSIRQTAMLHSFDIVNGQSTWVNLSANDRMRMKISSETSSCETLKPRSLSTLAGSFAASLLTHIIAFEWCVENWRAYINYLDGNLYETLYSVHNAPVEVIERGIFINSSALLEPLLTPATISSSTPTPGSPLQRGSTFNTNRTFSHQATFRSALSQQNRVLTLTSLGESIQPPPTRAHSNPQMAQTTQPAQLSPGLPSNEPIKDPFSLLEGFTMESMQKLNKLGSDLHTATMLTELNSNILRQQLAYYQALFKDEDFPREIKTECRRQFEDFERRTESIRESLQMEQARLATMRQMLEDGKAMMEKLWQFKNMEVSKLFAVHSYQNAERMERMNAEMHQSTLNMESATYSMHNIADKTEKKTASMHIITLVTLLFLPGTFVATFFGSGLFQWPEMKEGEDGVPNPVWKPEFFKLFSLISFPMMGATLIIWLAAYLYAKRKSAAMARGPDVEAGTVPDPGTEDVNAESREKPADT